MFGEVVGITLRGFDDCIIDFTKRKSIHVLPSSNAYWNYMAIQASVKRYLRAQAPQTFDRNSSLVRRAISSMVHTIHLREVEATYSQDGHMAQYYTAHMYLRHNCLGFIVHADDGSYYNEFVVGIYR
jgi:predicted HD phosphohydrolase